MGPVHQGLTTLISFRPLTVSTSPSTVRFMDAFTVIVALPGVKGPLARGAMVSYTTVRVMVLPSVAPILAVIAYQYSPCSVIPVSSNVQDFCVAEISVIVGVNIMIEASGFVRIISMEQFVPAENSMIPSSVGGVLRNTVSVVASAVSVTVGGGG